MTESASHVSPATLELLGLPSHQRDTRGYGRSAGLATPGFRRPSGPRADPRPPAHNANAPSDRNFWRLRNGQDDVNAEILYRSSARRRCRHHGQHRTPVLALQMTIRPGERRFYGQILDAFQAPQNPGARIVDIERSALHLLRNANIQVVVIDEVHNILAGSHREQRTRLNMLRYISNEPQRLARLLWRDGGARSFASETPSSRAGSTF